MEVVRYAAYRIFAATYRVFRYSSTARFSPSSSSIGKQVACGALALSVVSK